MNGVTQDSSVTSTEEAITACPKTAETSPDHLPKIPSCQLNVVKIFPWMADFFKLAKTEIPISNIQTLEKLMNFYIMNVEHSVRGCYFSKPLRAAKLKRAMSDALIFFHLTFSQFKRPFEHSSYLAKMSDLMAMFMDMEIKASRIRTESLYNIASKLCSCLHIYLSHSVDYIIDTILKTEFINKNSRKLSNLIFRRVLRDSPSSAVYIISYIRYILAFKMWKRTMKWPEDRKKITKLASLKLQPPPDFREKLSANGLLRDIFPHVPRTRTDVTTFLMQAKYSVRDKAKLFLKAVADLKLLFSIDDQNLPLRVVRFSNMDKKENNENTLFKNESYFHKLFLEEVGKDECSDPVEDETIKSIKLEVIEPISKDQDNHVDSVFECNETNLLEGSSSPIGIQAIKLEDQPSHLQEVAACLSGWSVPSIQSYHNNFDLEYMASSKSVGFSLDRMQKNNIAEDPEILIRKEISTDKEQETGSFYIEEIDETVRENDKPCILPIKKRKSFTYNRYMRDDKLEISYPSTPMISIAELELGNDKYNLSAVDMNHSSINFGGETDYTSSYLPHSNYPTPNYTKHQTVIVKPYLKTICAEQTLVPRKITRNYFTAEHQRIKFKTPAQLKDFQHLSEAEDAQLKEFQHLSAAEDLINFAQISRSHYNISDRTRKSKKLRMLSRKRKHI